MKKIFTLFFLLAMTGTAVSQITLTKADMPVPGDTIRFSNTLVLDGMDYQANGEGITWDFSQLTVMTQDVDTFTGVGSTPLAYQLIFNNPIFYPNHVATVAEKNSAFDFIPNIDLSEAYIFNKANDEVYAEIGAGVTLNDIPLPVSYDQFDILYQFPLSGESQWSSAAVAELDIPGLGYFLMNRERENEVVGWGTLITPYGSFEVLKVMSVIEEYDSLYVDSLNLGFPVNRNITEYKWLANGLPAPVLKVTEEGFTVMASYIDSVRSSFLSVGEPKHEVYGLRIFPNPARDHLTVSYDLTEPAHVSLTVLSLEGKVLTTHDYGVQREGPHERTLTVTSLPGGPGVYVVRLIVNGRNYSDRVIIN